MLKVSIDGCIILTTINFKMSSTVVSADCRPGTVIKMFVKDDSGKANT